MKTFEEDKELKSLIKNIKLDSPQSNFTVRVMNRIFKEDSVLERLKNEKILGKGFWIILLLFIAIFIAMFIFSGSGANDGIINRFLPDINTTGVRQEYENFFHKIGTVPISIAGILAASSILLFIERFLNSKSKTITK